MAYRMTIADVRAKNKAIGQYWFEPSTMRFFNSKIETGLYGNKYFVTSERFEISPEYPKKYSVRIAKPDGSIDTIGEHGEFKTKEDAIEHIKSLLGRK
jgi:hypothetical protein